MPAATPSSFAPATLEAHPLLRRLSGQAIWLLLEERGVGEEAIGEFLDRWNARRAEALEALDRLLDPNGAAAGMRIVVPEGACPDCAPAGLVVPAGHPFLAALCPPYALDCPARAEVLETGHPDLARALAPDDPGPASPHGHLLCPHAPAGGDWPKD